MTRITAIFFLLLSSLHLVAQIQDFNQVDVNGNITQRNGVNNNITNDSINKNKDKEIPKGLKVWTVDERFGDISPATPDTLSHMFQNSIFTILS